MEHLASSQPPRHLLLSLHPNRSHLLLLSLKRCTPTVSSHLSRVLRAPVLPQKELKVAAPVPKKDDVVSQNAAAACLSGGERLMEQYTSHFDGSFPQWKSHHGLGDPKFSLRPISAQILMSHNLDIYTSYPSSSGNMSLGFRAGSENCDPPGLKWSLFGPFEHGEFQFSEPPRHPGLILQCC